MPRTYRVTLKVDADERTAWFRAARIADIGLSEWIRQAAYRELLAMGLDDLAARVGPLQRRAPDDVSNLIATRTTTEEEDR